MTAQQSRPGLIVLLFFAGTLAALQYAKLPWMMPGLQQSTPLTLLEQAVLLSFIGGAGVLAGTAATPKCRRFEFLNALAALRPLHREVQKAAPRKHEGPT